MTTMISPNTLLRVPVSDEVLNTLEAQAKTQGKSVEEIAAARLMRFASVDSTKPIVLDDAARQHVDKLFGKNFSTPEELVAMIQRGLSIYINGAEISLTPYLLDRLKTRCIGVDFDKFLAATIKRLLEEYAGLR